MKLSVQHTFDCTPEEFWEMYWDEAYDEMLTADSDVVREIVSEREEDGIIVRRLRFTPNKELPRAFAKLLGTNKLVYEQENRWNRTASTMTWEVIPTVLPGKLTARGTFSVQPHGSGCIQTVDGDISVNVRFIGGQIEKGVVEEVRKTYERTGRLTRDFLARRKG